ncbi:MAG: hypothetical protein IIA02_08615 [Proteobacteria bacterium]|nr:hypothetical protein [Pseudomonadota bacterium]
MSALPVTPPKALTAYRPFWAKRFGPAPFLPMSRQEMEQLGSQPQVLFAPVTIAVDQEGVPV